MSKKIIFLSTIVMCAFVYGCGAQKDIDEQQSGTGEMNVIENNNSWANEIVEIPVAEEVEWWPIIMQWDRSSDAVEINENFDETI